MRLRVLTYNIHKCVGSRDRRYDPERIASVIAHYEPDVVLLQEVAQGAKLYRGERQMERLCELLDIKHSAYVVNVRKLAGGEYGNAILSRHPLSAVENVDLRVPPKKARAALHAAIDVEDEPGHSRKLHVFSLHLGLSGIERGLQIERFLVAPELLRLTRQTPVVVAGDFNDLWGRLGRKLVPAGFVGPPTAIATYPAYAPLRPLDSIYVRGDAELAHCFRSRLELAREASDHLPLVADLDLWMA